MKILTEQGMFAGFIDFRKAYYRVDREKLLVYLERMATGGLVASFLKAYGWMDVSSKVKVGKVHSKPFRVACGL